MTNWIDAAFERLQKIETEIRSLISTGVNEADTRHGAIDRLLFEVLHWSHEAVKAEPSSLAGYID